MPRNATATLIVAVLVVAGLFIAVRTFGTTGEEAVDRMSAEERAFLAKLQSLRRGMSFAEVRAVLGAPNDDGPLQMRPKWLVGGNPLNGVAVYNYADGADHFTWISIGRFTYEEKLRSGNRLERPGRSRAFRA
jgi:hypothetical protein